MIETLNILEGYILWAAGQASTDALHLIAEAQKIGFADRSEYVSDPDLVNVSSE